MNHFKRYILFWLSQALSQLGSAMTGFALILWAYTQDGSAMTVSLLSFFQYIPYIAASVFAGSFVDRHSKKKIMLAADSAAAACSVIIFALSMCGRLSIWNIYAANFIGGFMNAFQGPAAAVAVGRVVPKDKVKQISGMNSFSGNMVTVLSPVLAAALFAWGGLPLVLLIDLASFGFAFLVLLFVLQIPETAEKQAKSGSAFAGSREGIAYLRGNRLILRIMLTMAVLISFPDLPMKTFFL